MNRFIVLISVLDCTDAVAQQQLNLREMRQHGKRVVLTSHGDASIEKRSGVAPWELRKSLADPTGMPQIPVEDFVEETSTPLASAAEFIQDVNGSTPTGYVTLGTPGKKLLAIFDTGSDKFVAKTWETLENEMAQLDPSSEGMATPTAWVYDHSSSKTYQHEMVWKNSTKEWVPKKSIIAYGSGVAQTLQGKETLSVGRVTLENFSLSEITADSLQLLHTKKGIAAVLGLQHMKNASLGSSLFSVARNKSLMEAFGYVRGSGNNGSFLWGDQSKEGDEIPVIGDMHWAVHIGDLAVVGGSHSTNKPAANASSDSHHTVVIADPEQSGLVARQPSFPKGFPFASDVDSSREAAADVSVVGEAANPFHAPRRHPPTPRNTQRERDDLEDGAQTDEQPDMTVCANMSCCGILDSGSNIIAGPSHAMKHLADQLAVLPSCSNYESLPDIQLNFGGKMVNISKEGYVMKVPMPEWADPSSSGESDGADGDDGSGGAAGDADADGSGGGDGADDAGGDDGSGGSDGSSLGQRAVRHRSKTGWRAVFDHLHKKRGIDLKPIVRDFLTDENATEAKFLCMPALVPLDKHTKFGDLLVIGTPLLQTHYARWSFGKNKTSPSIFLKKLTDCQRCKGLKPTELTMNGTLLQVQPENMKPNLMRSEQRAVANSTPIPRAGPHIREIDDISFPHWARHLTHV